MLTTTIQLKLEFKMNKNKWLIIVISLLLLISCNLVPCGWDYDLYRIHNKPTTKFLIGNYKPDERTRNYIKEYKNAELILEENGSLIFKNTPIRTFDFMNYYDETEKNVNAIGKWKVKSGNYTANLDVDLNFEKAYSKLDYSTTWKIYEKEGKAVIFIIIGDPDSCAVARFIKT